MDKDEQVPQRDVAQQWLRLDARPFPALRTIIEQDLSRSLDDVKEIRIDSEVREIPSDAPWKRYEATQRRWITIKFPDRPYFLRQEADYTLTLLER